jgi:uncharacterized protein (UPF0333 family)
MDLPNEKTCPLNGNHLEIVKYVSKEDNNFITVSGNIVKMSSKIREDSYVLL